MLTIRRKLQDPEMRDAFMAELFVRGRVGVRKLVEERGQELDPILREELLRLLDD